MKKKTPKKARAASERAASGKYSERLINHLLAREFSPSQCLEALTNTLTPMVTPLFFEGQGFVPSTSNIDLTLVLKNFLKWLSKAENHQNLRAFAASAVNFPRSDELLLSRLFLKFFRSQKVSTPHISAFQNGRHETMSDLEYLEWQAGIASAHVLDSFSEMLNTIEGENRLFYQLYLEGLFPEELSVLFSIPEDEVHVKISECKRIVGKALLKEVA